MVFLTKLLSSSVKSYPFYGPTSRYKSPPTEKSWKKDFYKRMVWFLADRKRHCTNLTRNPAKKFLKRRTTERGALRSAIKDVWSTRIAAGCAEHGIQFSPFMKSLHENNIVLDRKMLSSLAIYEPRSFQSICEFVKKQQTQRVIEGTEYSPELGPSGLITNDMIDRVFKIRLEDPQFAKVTGSHAYVPKRFVPSSEAIKAPKRDN